MGSNIVNASRATPLPRAGHIERPQPTHGGSRLSEFSELLGPSEQRTVTGAHAATSADPPDAQRAAHTHTERSAASVHAYGPPPVHASQGTEPLTEAGRRLLARISRGERFVAQVVHGAANGAAYSPADLLAIQAQVYRYTHEVELLSKFVDRATNTVKVVLQQGS